MAIRLHIQENKVRLKVGEGSALRLKASEGIPIYPSSYEGAYRITPTEETQTLATDHLMMNDNVTIDPIPSNYGRILWDGSVLTVY